MSYVYEHAVKNVDKLSHYYYYYTFLITQNLSTRIYFQIESVYNVARQHDCYTRFTRTRDEYFKENFIKLNQHFDYTAGRRIC